MPYRVFISYRTDESPAESVLVKRKIEEQIGDNSVFVDAICIASGQCISDRVNAALADAELLIALITPNWLDGRRNNGGTAPPTPSKSWIEYEITSALKLGIPIVPVLVRHAKIPPIAELPVALHPITLLKRQEIRPEAIEVDIQSLCVGLPLRRALKPPGNTRTERLPPPHSGGPPITVDLLAELLQRSVTEDELDLIVTVANARDSVPSQSAKTRKLRSLLDWIHADEARRIPAVYQAACRFSLSFQEAVADLGHVTR